LRYQSPFRAPLLPGRTAAEAVEAVAVEAADILAVAAARISVAAAALISAAVAALILVVAVARILAVAAPGSAVVAGISVAPILAERPLAAPISAGDILPVGVVGVDTSLAHAAVAPTLPAAEVISAAGLPFHMGLAAGRRPSRARLAATISAIAMPLWGKTPAVWLALV
jgi:hypothetical protein